jgi:hypothetical protein
MRSALTPLTKLSHSAILAVFTLSSPAVLADAQTDMQAVQKVVENYAQAYETRDSTAILASFPEAFFAAISSDPQQTKNDRRAALKEWFETFFGRFPPADTSALDAHWSRWQNRTVDWGETFQPSEGGRLVKVNLRGSYYLQERQWKARRTLIAVQENHRWFLMDPALSHLRRVMRRAYPVIADADAKGTARMIPLEN